MKHEKILDTFREAIATALLINVDEAIDRDEIMLALIAVAGNLADALEANFCYILAVAMVSRLSDAEARALMEAVIAAKGRVG